MRNYALTLILALCLLFQSCDSITVDNAMSAVEGGDYTALIEGCGNQLVPGYTYCRMTEGDATKKRLWLVGPITNCEREACVFFRFYDNKGEIAYAGSIPKKSTRTSVFWSDLVKRDTFQVGDRGFWPFIYEVYWVDADGNEHKAMAEGEIRLRVLKEGYIPLHESADDPNFTWTLNHDGTMVRMTTKMRTYVSRKVVR
jgi:hypothetical protein